MYLKWYKLYLKSNMNNVLGLEILIDFENKFNKFKNSEEYSRLCSLGIEEIDLEFELEETDKLYQDYEVYSYKFETVNLYDIEDNFKSDFIPSKLIIYCDISTLRFLGENDLSMYFIDSEIHVVNVKTDSSMINLSIDSNLKLYFDCDLSTIDNNRYISDYKLNYLFYKDFVEHGGQLSENKVKTLNIFIEKDTYEKVLYNIMELYNDSLLKNILVKIIICGSTNINDFVIDLIKLFKENNVKQNKKYRELFLYGFTGNADKLYHLYFYFKFLCPLFNKHINERDNKRKYYLNYLIGKIGKFD